MSLMLVFMSAMAALAPDQILVAPAGLEGLKKVLVVDVRTAEQFQAGHIPGAAHLDQATLSEDRDGVANELKDTEVLGGLLAAAGIDSDRHLVVYTGMERPDDIKNASRAFWILEYLSYDKVSVLDGGFARWKAEGHPVETGETKVGPVKRGKVDIRPRQALLAEYETVVEMTATGQGILVDCRVPSEYAGLSKKDFVAKKGNIPGAINVPAVDLVDAKTGLLKPANDLAAAIAPMKLDDDQPVVTYCNSGRDATVGYLAMRLAGHARVAVYDGSMSEWAAKEVLPVGAATGK